MKYPSNIAFKKFDIDVHHPADFRGDKEEEKPMGFKEKREQAEEGDKP